MKRHDPTGERGSAPLELVLGIGLILIPLALISLSFGPLLQRMVFTRIAAAEAARELVLSDGSETDVLALVGQMALNHGLAIGGVAVGFCGGATGPATSPPRSVCGPPVKGEVVTVLVTTRSPAFWTPYGAVGAIMIRASHTEMVGLYRSTR